jgi:hypothetical protein
VLAFALVAALGSGLANAAGECRIEFGCHTDNPGRDHVDERTFNLGQTIAIYRSKLNFVKIGSSRKVKVNLNGALFNDVILSSNQVEPPVAFFLTPTTLETSKCLRQASNGQFFDTADQLVAILKAMGANANTVARELVSHFNMGLTQATSLLKQAGYSINQVADAARDVFNASATQVAGALKSTFNASIDDALFEASVVRRALQGQSDAPARESTLKGARGGRSAATRHINGHGESPPQTMKPCRAMPVSLAPALCQGTRSTRRVVSC